MPIQAPQWTEFLSCPVCFHVFDEEGNGPISLGCGHTVCKLCLSKLNPKKCPFDQNVITRDINELPVNFALLQLVGVNIPENQDTPSIPDSLKENVEDFNSATKCIEELAIYLKPIEPDEHGNSLPPPLSRPMQRKLVTLVNCQLLEEEGRARAARAARSLGDRTVTELILQHQNPQQLSANLWAAVRARGCQFLGPAMQEEVLKLILLSLEDGSALSRKVLVLFVVQRLESQYPQASKTAIGHVVQLLYRASCFKVTKRDDESSLMQLKVEFCLYEALRREHDSQIVQIATEAGLRISPEQWSSLLYGDTAHKSHMQSIIDKLQTPQSFSQSINELTIALQRNGDPANLSALRPHMDLLASVDASSDGAAPAWKSLTSMMQSVKAIVDGLVLYTRGRVERKVDLDPSANPKYKTSLCRDMVLKGKCPRGNGCTFAHSQEELNRFRIKNRRMKPAVLQVKQRSSGALTAEERQTLATVTKAAQWKLGYTQTSDPTRMAFSSMPGGVQPPFSISMAKASVLPPRLMGGAYWNNGSVYMHKFQRDHSSPTLMTSSCRYPGEGLYEDGLPQFHPGQHDQDWELYLQNGQDSGGPLHNTSSGPSHNYVTSVPDNTEGYRPVGNGTVDPNTHILELQHRRSELLAQLGKIEPSNSVFSTWSENVPTNSMATLSMSACNNAKSDYPPTGGANTVPEWSVADSLASSINTMALTGSRSAPEDSKLFAEGNRANGTVYSPWTSGPALFTNLAPLMNGDGRNGSVSSQVYQ